RNVVFLLRTAAGELQSGGRLFVAQRRVARRDLVPAARAAEEAPEVDGPLRSAECRPQPLGVGGGHQRAPGARAFHRAPSPSGDRTRQSVSVWIQYASVWAAKPDASGAKRRRLACFTRVAPGRPFSFSTSNVPLQWANASPSTAKLFFAETAST